MGFSSALLLLQLIGELTAVNVINFSYRICHNLTCMLWALIHRPPDAITNRKRQFDLKFKALVNRVSAAATGLIVLSVSSVCSFLSVFVA
jgi:hypothetical protein